MFASPESSSHSTFVVCIMIQTLTIYVLYAVCTTLPIFNRLHPSHPLMLGFQQVEMWIIEPIILEPCGERSSKQGWEKSMKFPVKKARDYRKPIWSWKNKYIQHP